MAAPVTPGKAKTIWQPRFVNAVHEGTGIPKLVLWAWVLLEDGPPENPLNIVTGPFGSVDAAARATIALLHTSRYAPILRAARTGNDQAVIRAIVASPWATDPRYGEKLRGTYKRAEDEHPGADTRGGRVGAAVEAEIVEPIERAAASVETFLVEKAKLSLAYVGLTTASVVLFIVGLQLATGAPGVGMAALRARATAGRGGGDIPF